jgi:hypothetical protein
MVTVVGMLEREHPQKFEHLCWKQIRGAFQVKVILVGFDYETMQEALQHTVGHRVFFIPPNRTTSIDFKDFTPHEGDSVYVFGRPGDNLVKYINPEDTVVSIHTPGSNDLMDER